MFFLTVQWPFVYFGYTCVFSCLFSLRLPLRLQLPFICKVTVSHSPGSIRSFSFPKHSGYMQCLLVNTQYVLIHANIIATSKGMYLMLLYVDMDLQQSVHGSTAETTREGNIQTTTDAKVQSIVHCLFVGPGFKKFSQKWKLKKIYQ